MPFDNPHHTPIGDLEILMDARRRISVPSYWVQGHFRDGDRRCLVAALSSASGSPSVVTPNRTERRIARMLANQLPSHAPFWMTIRLVSARQRLMCFNDDSRTCHEDVIALFDRTISHLVRKDSELVRA
jgi:hypothetical protein